MSTTAIENTLTKEEWNAVNEAFYEATRALFKHYAVDEARRGPSNVVDVANELPPWSELNEIVQTSWMAVATPEMVDLVKKIYGLGRVVCDPQLTRMLDTLVKGDDQPVEG